MTLAFILTMPNCGSWNGRWSGERNCYAVVRKFSDSSKIAARIKGRNFYYRWSDGWGANVEVCQVEREQIRNIKKTSKGFCGYEWMIKSIIERDKILADHEIEEVTNDN